METNLELLRTKTAKYFAILKVGYQSATVYTGDMITLGLLVALRVFILSQLYRVTYATLDKDVINGLTLPMTMWLITLAQSQQLTSSTRQMIRNFQDEIKNGNIAYTLSKPYSLVLYLYSQYLGRFCARIPPAVGLGLLAAWILVGSVAITWQALFAAAILAIFGFTLNMILTVTIGLGAFWFEEVTAFRWVYDKLQWIFSGMIIPLALFPASIRSVAEYTPFGLLFYPAARIFVGFENTAFIRYLVLQLVWIIVFGTIMFSIYKRGSKNVAINGG